MFQFDFDVTDAQPKTLIHFAAGWTVLSKSEAKQCSTYFTSIFGAEAHGELGSKKAQVKSSLLAGAMPVCNLTGV